jgi:hypothetical protein
MVGMEIYSSIITLLTLILGGGWFVHYRAHKRQEEAKATQEEEIAEQQKADAFKLVQDVYQQAMTDMNNILMEVRSDRDRYHDQRDNVIKENEEMRKKYIAIEERMTAMDIKYKKDISRLNRRIDVLSPFLCGVVGCMKRTQVNLADTIDESNLATHNE